MEIIGISLGIISLVLCVVAVAVTLGLSKRTDELIKGEDKIAKELIDRMDRRWAEKSV